MIRELDLRVRLPALIRAVPLSLLTKQRRCYPAAGKVTVGLASRWPCVTDFSSLSTYWLVACVLCSRSRGSYISRLLKRLPRTSQTTVAFCRTLVVAHCGPTPMTCGSCSCREHITNSVIGVSRPPVLDCGTTFHLDYGGRDLPLTPSDNL